MKGGVTSGIVYPNAVLALAKEFRFKAVGGTSAGAIAAAVTAAAAFGDRSKQGREALADDDRQVGFEGLADVAAQLATERFIYDLFQPARGARNAYRAIVVLAGKAHWLRKLATLLVAVLAIAPLEFLLVLGLLLAIAFAFAQGDGVLAALLPSLACAYLAGAICAALRIARVARANLLGLCSGMRGNGGAKPALTEWLHDTLQRLAGKPQDAPLTFADLRGAPRYPDEPATPHAIVLRMITTGVSHREPRTLPFRDVRFWFLREEFDRLFPKVVMDWMVDHGGVPVTLGGKTYFPLPDDDALPVLVATRLSLSFPLLVSAVPLHEPARRNPAVADEEAVERASMSTEKSVAESADHLASGGTRAPTAIAEFRACWFSDGGISSNFPIHLFDAALPLWPTFAIDLVYPGSDDRQGTEREPVFLPERNAQGWQRTYQSIGARGAVPELVNFLFGIVATMQNWRDLLLARAPGQRDRIVHVSLAADEGGMNLDMPQDVLARIAAKGTAAGERFNEFSFANHYWIRWRSLAAALQQYTQQVGRTANTSLRVADYAEVYVLPESAESEPPSYVFKSWVQRTESARLLHALIAQGAAWDDMQPDLAQGAPRPAPQMKVTPIY
jgi:hypothetical protein